MPYLKFYNNQPNLVRIKAKTNGLIVKIFIDISQKMNLMEPYQAMILDNSNEFQTYEVIKIN